VAFEQKKIPISESQRKPGDDPYMYITTVVGTDAEKSFIQV
jgi:hypothetical protein